MKGKYRRICVIANERHGMHRDFLLGVERYVSEKAHIEIILSGPPFETAEWKAQRLDGAITVRDIPLRCARWFSRNNIPLAWFTHPAHRPLVQPDQVLFYRDGPNNGRMAADHFLERGFRSFAYLHLPTNPGSQGTGEGFTQRLREAGADCDWFVYESQVHETRGRFHKRVIQWLTSQPIPVAILAFNDSICSGILPLLHQSQLTCPGNVALLGIDNDELRCKLTTPSLSSVDANWRDAGWRIAQCLDRMIDGHWPTERFIPIGPKGVVLRASTDFLAIDDEQTLKALCYIRENISQSVKPKDVLDQVNISRLTLDRRFMRHLGHTVFEEIIASQISLAKTLLTTTDMTIENISYQCGFPYSDRLFGWFKKHTGMTPRAFRKQSQVV